MRLRNRPEAQEMMDTHPEYVVHSPETLKGKWSGRFNNSRPIHLEIGTGKGQFIIEMAKQHPDVNFIGIELHQTILLYVLEKQIEEQLPNVQLIEGNAAHLEDYFAPGEVNRMYLNFSDPWPKNRHRKRRLTYSSFLSIYKEILDPTGEIQFKTDNRGLFEYSLISFSDFGAKLTDVQLDLHHSDVKGNVMTEFEEKFSKKEQPIYRAVFSFPHKE